MDEQRLFDTHRPVYNIKAVSRLIGLLPVTLRAWERRYGLPSPSRGEQGYRLYSEHDVRTLRWLKAQLEAGLSISRAVEYLNELRTAGRDPAEVSALPYVTQPASLSHLSQDLLQSLVQFNEGQANEILRRSFSLFAMDQVLTEIVQPALVEIGERWHRGELPIAAEHFATQFCMQTMFSMIASSNPPTHPGVLVAACAPGETHQIGLLMIVVMLRWRGWDVKYLGPDLNLERLSEALEPIRPRMLLFTATREESAVRLEALSQVLAQFPAPHPLVVLGGQAFQARRLPESVPAIYIQSPPSLSVAMIEELLQS